MGGGGGSGHHCSVVVKWAPVLSGLYDSVYEYLHHSIPVRTTSARAFVELLLKVFHAKLDEVSRLVSEDLPGERLQHVWEFERNLGKCWRERYQISIHIFMDINLLKKYIKEIETGNS